MNVPKRLVGLLLLAASLCAMLALAPATVAAPIPAWEITSLATPTNFVPGDSGGDYSYDVRVVNIGTKVMDGSDITIVDTLPSHLEAGTPELKVRFQGAGSPPPEPVLVDLGPSCDEEESAPETVTLSCTVSQLPGDQHSTAALGPLEELKLVVPVFTPSAVGEGQTLTNHVEVEGGGAAPASASFQNEVSSEPAASGFAYFRTRVSDEEGNPATLAGSHPFQMTTSFALDTTPGRGNDAAFVAAGGDLKDVHVLLPPGLVGNPNAATPCSAQDFTTIVGRTVGNGGFYTETACPESSVIGAVSLKDVDGQKLIYPTPLYNLVPEPGSPAQFGFQYANVPFYIDAELRRSAAGGGYVIEAVVRNTSQARRVTAASVTIWGTPADESHDGLRGGCLLPGFPQFGFSRGLCDAGIEDPKPFFRLPTNCETPMDLTMSIDTWTDPDTLLSQTSPGLVPTGCDAVEFDPTLQVQPGTTVADSPTGLNVHLHLPQKEHEAPATRAQADLRDVVVSLPPGLSVNPSSANGLQACSPGQIDLKADDPPQCPAASMLGEVEATTPLIDHALPGEVYAATPFDNPFGSLLAIYIVVDDPRSGLVVKLPGKVTADPVTGQLQSTISQSPQAPIEDFTLKFFGGDRAALRSPAVCGPYSTTSTLTPWSAATSASSVVYRDGFSIMQAPGGGPCATSEFGLPNSPTFNAGMVVPIAKAYSPLVVNLRREDGSQEFGAVSVSLPPGVLANLADVPSCPDSAIVAAASRSGAAEKASPSCPQTSKLGVADVGAGAGPTPYYAQGNVYWAGPYKGAPFSLAIVTPATAGPYDLGTVVVRVPLRVDPETARVSAVSDPIPSILQGIPLDIRSISFRIDRPDFTFNPTNCDPFSVEAAETSTLGRSAKLANRFQVGDCGRLRYSQNTSFRLKGATHRGAHPRLRAVITYPPGEYANTARVSVALPHSEFLEQSHIRTICTRVQFTADSCPKGSIYGEATVTSPILGYALTGHVYLRSSSHALPDLVLALEGPPSQPLKIAAVGRIDSVHGGIRVTFDSIPDAPLGKVVVTMDGGKRGLLVNSRNICKYKNRATVKFDAQNSKFSDFRPLLKAECGPKK